MKWFWLSFADGALPEGEQFLGVVVMPVDDTIINIIWLIDSTDRIDLLRDRGQVDDIPFYAAVEYARFLGLNPGGEVQGYEITHAIEKIPEDMRGRLLSVDELKAADLV